MTFFGPSGFDAVELNLAAPHKVFWVGALLAVALAILRAMYNLTADFSKKLPGLVLFLYTVGAYAMAYVCIHMAHNLESYAERSPTIMMMRWAHVFGAVFLAYTPVLVVIPQVDDEDVSAAAALLGGVDVWVCCWVGLLRVAMAIAAGA